MVMETPSPQCVGHEFVRQYYTVLNKAPMYLHRFYSHNSLFMHGGPNSVSDPIVGQTDIHKKILSLNFQDCHAKIRMVDAHATLGSGVVIQVIGELSNSGNPMRRFMQTFVLAPQSPKKFYVHNDIFRYQDEVFNDDESTDEGITCDPEEEIEAPSSTTGESNFQHSSTTMNGSSHHQLEEQTQIDSHPTPPSEPHISSPTQKTPSPPVVPVAPTTVPAEPRPSTPPMPEADGWGSATQPTDPYDSLDESSSAMTPTKESTPHVDAPVPQTSEPAPPSPRPATSVARTPSSPVAPIVQATPVKIQPAEPKTYANLFKGNTYSSQTQPQLQPPHSVTRQQTSPSQPAAEQNTSPLSTQQPRSESVRSNSSSLAGGPPPSNSFQTNNSFRNVSSSGRGMGFSSDEDKRRPMPDSQQVFVGNLPHNIGEDELRAEFSKFGPVSDVRINLSKGKTGLKGPGHQVPNFGFVTFEDEETVRSCLAQKPILLNGDHRINVEEKKARSRTEGGMGGRPSSGRGGGGNMGMSSRGGGGGNSMMMGRGGRGGGGFGSREGGRGISSGGPRGGGGFMPRR